MSACLGAADHSAWNNGSGDDSSGTHEHGVRGAHGAHEGLLGGLLRAL